MPSPFGDDVPYFYCRAVAVLYNRIVGFAQSHCWALLGVVGWQVPDCTRQIADNNKRACMHARLCSRPFVLRWRLATERQPVCQRA